MKTILILGPAPLLLIKNKIHTVGLETSLHQTAEIPGFIIKSKSQNRPKSKAKVKQKFAF